MSWNPNFNNITSAQWNNAPPTASNHDTEQQQHQYQPERNHRQADLSPSPFPSPALPQDTFNDIRKDQSTTDVEVGVWDENEGKVVKREHVEVEKPQRTTFDKVTGIMQGVLDAFGCSFIPINILRRKGEIESDNDFEVIVTERGIVYQKRYDDEKSTQSTDDAISDTEVIKEHVQSRLTPFALMKKIEKVYGLSMFLYFDFIRFIILLNVVLTLLQMANYVIHWIVDVQNQIARGDSFFGWMYFIISSSHYSNAQTSVSFFSSLWLWRGTNIAAILITFVVGPVYFLYASIIFRMRKVKDTENFSRHTRLDIIKENMNTGFFGRLGRRILVYTFILVMLIIQFGVVFGLTRVQVALSNISSNSGDEVQDAVTFITNTGASVLISFFVVVLNILFRFIGTSLTRFEKYKTYTGFKQSNLIKLLLFKVLNVFVVGVAKTVDTGSQCPLSLIGQQYLILMLIDVLLMNVLDVAKPILNRMFWCCLSTVCNKERKSKRNSDAELKPEFNITEEYVELIYREYLIYLSTPAFPLAPLLGLVGGFAELFVDRVKLMRFCRKPPIANASMKSTLSFFLLFIAVFAAFNPGSGSIYLLHLFPYWCDRSNCSGQCFIFEGKA
mmetsp:Transcript_5565/g.20936  ORF Transcript_5565/g.20936 Transcript_5565/m.20936 type:complete len:614 (-) Transcript_5565:3850-5691(-)|eukprot:CAMPEP_0117447512 /NCGR_PEP_ID=MMETSP0759-20121206/6916_1 /TAXON_ID=63605 /ORGANISM="Percolomonas cosmopolitus, Strain WS" /LENGTH=613 /DNA_ID=CAMNT_0005239855 /DNA_START=172 /DNA_END=2013 /DNA_ORIENTATION=-